MVRTSKLYQINKKPADLQRLIEDSWALYAQAKAQQYMEISEIKNFMMDLFKDDAYNLDEKSLHFLVSVFSPKNSKFVSKEDFKRVFIEAIPENPS